MIAVLVAAIARQSDSHVLSGKLAYAISRYRRTVGKRLIVNFGDLIDKAEVL